MTTVRLRVAGLTLAARAARALPGLRLPEKLRTFAAARGGDISLDVVEDEPPRPANGACLFDSGGLWSVHRHGGGRLYVFGEPVAGRPPMSAVLVDERLRRGTLFMPPRPQSHKRGYALGFPLDELLFQHRLALEGGIVLHAAAVRVRGGAIAFCGASGAGKTTLARLCRRAGLRVMSDDRVVLRARGGRVRAWGTPWHGSGRYASSESARLRAVFLLRQARESRAAPATEGAAARLFAATFPPLWDEAAIASTLAACGRIVDSVPVLDLAFRKDASALRAVESALGRPLRPPPRA